jgi:phasin
MNTPSPRTPTKSSGSVNGPQVLREAAESTSAQAKDAFEKMNAATQEATNMMKDTYAAAIARSQDYNAKIIEFAQTNTQSAFDFFQKLSSVRTPTEFFELSTSHSRRQLEVLSEQARELTSLAQKAAMSAAERAETDVQKAFSQRQ